MNNPGDLFYKCRMCGDEYADVHSPDIHTSLIGAILKDSGLSMQQSGFVPTTTMTHIHEDGSFGVSDLIGARPDENKTK